MIVFSEHAKQRMEQRGIDKKFVIETAEDPDKVDKSFRGHELRQKRFGDKILEVVTKTEKEEIVVVTQYWLSN